MSRAESVATAGGAAEARATVPTQRAVALATDGLVVNDLVLATANVGGGTGGILKPLDAGEAAELLLTQAGRPGLIKDLDPEA